MAQATTVTIYVPAPLREYSGGVAELSLSADNVRAALDALARSHPSLHKCVCDETGTVRRHVNLFVNANNVRDREGLETRLVPGDLVTIMPAVSGG